MSDDEQRISEIRPRLEEAARRDPDWTFLTEDVPYLLARIAALEAERDALIEDNTALRWQHGDSYDTWPLARLREPEYFRVGDRELEKTAVCRCCDHSWAWSYVSPEGYCLHCVDGRAELTARLAAAEAALSLPTVVSAEWDAEIRARDHSLRQMGAFVLRLFDALDMQARRLGGSRGDRSTPLGELLHDCAPLVENYQVRTAEIDRLRAALGGSREQAQAQGEPSTRVSYTLARGCPLTYRGAIRRRQDDGVIWECAHGHDKPSSARHCAQREFRQHCGQERGDGE